MSLESSIESPKKTIGKNVVIGPDVLIQAAKVVIGSNVSIGSDDDEESFRTPEGVRIKAHSLKIGDGTRISGSVLIKGGDIVLGKKVTVREHCTIDVRKKLVLGAKGYLNPHCRMMGRDIEIGRNFRMLTWASIGGGSCFEIHSKLRMGHDCHLGEFSFINTADDVSIGNEVGIGMRSAIFTHGAYQSFLKGYPVSFGPVRIEDNCWLPQAWVLPNVTIGQGTVVATGSLVNRDLPPFCLAGGIPAKVLVKNAFYNPLGDITKAQLMSEFLARLDEILLNVYGQDESERTCDGYKYKDGRCLRFFENLSKESLDSIGIREGDVTIALSAENGIEKDFKVGRGCLLLLDRNLIAGDQDDFSIRVVNQLRRYGVRF
ncbi:MAG: hypothetical protein ACFFD9_08375 [Candidatus Thorarchaeota archaeon]